MKAFQKTVLSLCTLALTACSTPVPTAFQPAPLRSMAAGLRTQSVTTRLPFMALFIDSNSSRLTIGEILDTGISSPLCWRIPAFRGRMSI